MIGDRSNFVLEKILQKIELPDGAYEKAEKRYQDIGMWFHRPESSCQHYDPSVFSQGSFRLGTAIRPEGNEAYDLDMGCNLQQGLTKDDITQKNLKILVGDELELYRRYRGIKEKTQEKKRCWRLEYADDLNFHMDVVPCMPESDIQKTVLQRRMTETAHLDYALAADVAALAVSITDNTDENYEILSSDWRISNPEGYAHWFESRMRTAETFLHERAMTVNASIDDLPYYQWKTPLQRVIQLLKRHRDTMYKNNEKSKPISIIITTLAAKAYNGEADLVSALQNILNTMERFINPSNPHVPNPVNSEEDFADKWYSDEASHLKLKENFAKWLFQAKADFTALCDKENSKLILEAAEHGLDVELNKRDIENLLGLTAAVISPVKAIEAENPRPWFRS